MGCGTEVICVDCKIRYNCGYGSYGRQQERAEKYPKEKHINHTIHIISEDWTNIRGNDLYLDLYDTEELLIKDYLLFQYIDLDKELLDKELKQ